MSEAQFVAAREAGFSSWPNLKRHVEGAGGGETAGSETLIDAALSGDDDAIAAALRRDPTVAHRSIYLAAALANIDAAFASSTPTRRSLIDQGEGAPRSRSCTCSPAGAGEVKAIRRVGIARRLLELGVSVSRREVGFRSTHGKMLSQDNELLAIEAAAGRSASAELVQVFLDAGADLRQTTVVLLQAVRGGNIRTVSPTWTSPRGG